jgi:hypothetical protein
MYYRSYAPIVAASLKTRRTWDDEKRESRSAVNLIFTLLVGRNVKRLRSMFRLRLGWVSGAALGQAWLKALDKYGVSYD